MKLLRNFLIPILLGGACCFTGKVACEKGVILECH